MLSPDRTKLCYDEHVTDHELWRTADGFLQDQPPPCPTCPRMTGVSVGVDRVEIWCIACGWASHDYAPPALVYTSVAKMVQYGSKIFVEVKQLLEAKPRLDG